MELRNLAPQEVSRSEEKQWQIAWWLAIFTIIYNLGEGVVATVFGFQDETLSLFGFGVDSFIEVISAVGIAHMIARICRRPNSARDAFEVTALKVTGTSFYLLTAGLVISAAVSLIANHHPETTAWGVLISLVSIVSMWILIQLKVRQGRRLESPALLADARCTRTCLQMSVVLLVASAVYEMTGIGYLDGLGALMIAYFAFQEGREAFEKAAGQLDCGCAVDPP